MPEIVSRLRWLLPCLVLICAGVPGTAAARQWTDEGVSAPAAPAESHQPAQHQIYLPILGNGVRASGIPSPARLSTPGLIDQAFVRGEITASQRILYLAYALYEPQSLPPQFHSNVGWHGTQVVLEVAEYLASVNVAATDGVHQELGRLSLLAATVCDNDDGPYSVDSTNFHFNYGAISGGLTITDYIKSMETTFGVEVTSYGWAKPPLCTGGGTCDGNTNPFGRYPIQIAAIGGGYYGYATTGGALYTGFVGDNPNTAATETAAVASCIVLNNDYSQFSEGAQAALDATTAHEFVHAIQTGYGDPGTVAADMWYESSATYMEDEVFDDSNSNYIYLWPVIRNSLGAWPNDQAPYGLSQYSNFLFFRYVAEQNGGVNKAGGGEEIMQHFWENIGAGQAALTAYSNALVAAGTNLADVFHKYAIATRFSKACGAGYSAPYCFEEGAGYVAHAGQPPPVQGSIAANPGSYTGSILNDYAANWINLPTSGSPYQVALGNTSGGGQLRASLVCDTGTAFVIAPFASPVGAGGAAAIASFNAAGCTNVTAVITNQEQLAGSRSSTAIASSYILTVSTAAPTGVTLAGFDAISQSDRVQLTWQTLDELGLAGFHLYRGVDPAGPGARITSEPIWAQAAGALQGHLYGYVDLLMIPSGTTIYYWLEELHADGGVIRHGPLSVGGAGNWQLYLPVIGSAH